MTDMRPVICADDVIVTDELDRRPSRGPDHEAESRALRGLAETMAASPDGVLQRLAEVAMTLTRSDSAGISLLEPGGEHGTFRWAAAAGAWAPYLNGTMPREASPCGEVIARGAVLLMREPARAFPALLQAEPGIQEGLPAPFHVGGEPLGTVWTVKHGAEGHFEREDARLLQSLTRFAAAAHRMTAALKGAQAGHRDSESRLALAIGIGGIGHWELSLTTGKLTTSAHCRRIFGRSEDVPFSYDELIASIHPDDRARQENAVRTAAEAKSGFDIEYRLNTPRGDMRWVQVRGRYEDGDHPRLAGVSQDITERRRAGAALRESEERLAFLLNFTDALRPLMESGDIEGRQLAFSASISRRIAVFCRRSMKTV